MSKGKILQELLAKHYPNATLSSPLNSNLSAKFRLINEWQQLTQIRYNNWEVTHLLRPKDLLKEQRIVVNGFDHVEKKLNDLKLQNVVWKQGEPWSGRNK